MGNPDDPNDAAGLSKYKIIRHAEDSLRRIGTDRIDLLQMHHVDRRAPWDEVWEAFELLMAQGKVVYVGSSNFAAWDLALAQAAAHTRSTFGLVSEQHRFNLLCRLPELEVLPAAGHLRIGLPAPAPLGVGGRPSRRLAGGRLGGDELRGGDRSRRARQAQPGRPDEQTARRLREFALLCRERDASQAAVATAWILAQPALTAAIIGPRTADQLRHLLPALDLTLDNAALARLDELFPGPGGSAPQAYAW